MKKIRKICANCKAKKYKKFLSLVEGKYVCKNGGKCKKRSPNYKK